LQYANKNGISDDPHTRYKSPTLFIVFTYYNFYAILKKLYTFTQHNHWTETTMREMLNKYRTEYLWSRDSKCDFMIFIRHIITVVVILIAFKKDFKI